MNPERARQVNRDIASRLARFVRIAATNDDPHAALADIGIRSADDMIEFLDDLATAPGFAERCDGARRAGERARERRREEAHPHKRV